MAELTAGIARVVDAMVKGKSELDAAAAKQVADALSKNFKLKGGEVAILRMSEGGRQLEFLVPVELSKIGTIPMTSNTALSVRTVRERRPDVINNFSNVKHHTVFEAVSFVKGAGNEPIQKIMSVPILVNKKSTGVIQVSRKGKTGAMAGPDFSKKDMQELTQVATALSPCFKIE